MLYFFLKVRFGDDTADDVKEKKKTVNNDVMIAVGRRWKTKQCVEIRYNVWKNEQNYYKSSGEINSGNV